MIIVGFLMWAIGSLVTGYFFGKGGRKHWGVIAGMLITFAGVLIFITTN
jgi:hypothetical protein